MVGKISGGSGGVVALAVVGFVATGVCVLLDVDSGRGAGGVGAGATFAGAALECGMDAGGSLANSGEIRALSF